MSAVHSRLPRTLPGGFDDLVRLYPPRAIADGIGHALCQERIDRLTSIPRLSAGQREYLETLTILLEAYEDTHAPLGDTDTSGLDALRYLLEANDMSASDLGRLLGDRALGSRILRGERGLSKAHIRTLCARFRVAPDLFWDVG